MKLVFLFVLLSSSVLLSQPSEWSARGIGGGGAVFSPSISPFDGNRMFLACDMGHISETRDFGRSWKTLNFRTLAGSHRSEVQFTSDPSILYTLRQSVQSSAYTPAKSTDGGLTWKALDANPTSGSALKLYANPHSTTQIVLSDKYCVYYSGDGGRSFARALYTETAPKGLHCAGVFFCDSVIFICLNTGVIRSTNGGASWSTTPGLMSGIDTASEEIVSFAGAQQGGSIMLVCVTYRSDAVAAKIEADELTTDFRNLYTLRYASADRGWTRRTPALPDSVLDKPFFVAMNQADTAVLYLGGATTVNVNGQHQLQTVFKTTDGGAHWKNIFLTAAGYLTNQNIHTGWLGGGADPSYNHSWYGPSMVTGICVDPKNVNRLAVANTSAIHVSTDGGATWTQAYVDPSTQQTPGSKIPAGATYRTSGLETAPTFWMHWRDRETILATYFDLTAARSTDGGRSWSFDLPGLWAKNINDVNKIVSDPRTGVLYAPTGDYPGSNGDYTDARVKTYTGRISYSTDLGETWKVLKDFKRSVTDLVLDPSNSYRMYAAVTDTINGAGGIYVCDSLTHGPSSVWRRVSLPPRTEGRALGIVALNNGDLVSWFGSRDKGGFQYTQSSGIFYSTDGGATWMDSTAPSMRTSVKSVTIDPNDPTQSTWWACVGAGGTTQPGLYRTTNKGGVWMRLYDTAAAFVSFHPLLKHTLYLSGERNGLSYSDETNAASPRFIPLSAFPSRCPQRVFFNPYDPDEVWVTTFGNGLYVGQTVITSASARPEETVPKRCELHQNYPNPFNPSTVIGYRLASAGHVALRIHDVLGRELATLVDAPQPAGDHTVTFDASAFSSGVYFYRLSAGEYSSVRKMLIAK